MVKDIAEATLLSIRIFQDRVERECKQIPHLVLVGNPSARLTRENLRQLWVTEFDIATGS